MAAPLVRSHRVIHSTTSMQMFAFPAVLAKQHALQVLSAKADILLKGTDKAASYGVRFLYAIIRLPNEGND